MALPTTLILPERSPAPSVTGAFSWVPSRMLDREDALLANTSGVTVGERYTGTGGGVLLRFEHDTGDGGIAGQHDGVNGIAARIDGGFYALEVGGTIYTSDVAPGPADFVGISWTGARSTLAINGILAVVEAVTPTLPAQDFTIGATGSGADGGIGAFTGMAFYGEDIAYLCPDVERGDWDLHTARLVTANVGTHYYPLEDPDNLVNEGTDLTNTIVNVIDSLVNPSQDVRAYRHVLVGGSWDGKKDASWLGPGDYFALSDGRTSVINAGGDYFVSLWWKTNKNAFSESYVDTETLISTDFRNQGTDGGHAVGVNSSYSPFSSVQGGNPQIMLYGNLPGTGLIYSPSGINSDTTLTDGKWHQYAMQKQGNQLQLFFDGKLVSTLDITGMAPPDRARLWFGIYEQSPTNDAYGAFSDLHFYDSAVITTAANGFDRFQYNLQPQTIAVGEGMFIPKPAAAPAANQNIATTYRTPGQGADVYGGLNLSANWEATYPSNWFPAEFDNVPFDHSALPMSANIQPALDTWESRNMQIQRRLVQVDLKWGSWAQGGFAFNWKTERSFNERNGIITGTVTDENATPVSRLVRLKDRASGQVVREQWADAAGSYRFSDLSTFTKYTIIAHDYTGTYNATVVDDAIAEIEQ